MKTALQIAMDRAEAMQAIPPITDPLGKYWQQPDRKRILIDDSHAVMSSRDFEALAEYSASNPSGVYPGKMWKRHNGAFDQAFLRRGGKPNWLLCWYGISEDPAMCTVQHRDILLSDGRLPGEGEKAA